MGWAEVSGLCSILIPICQLTFALVRKDWPPLANYQESSSHPQREDGPLLSGQAAQDVLWDLTQSYHITCLIFGGFCSPGKGFLLVPVRSCQVDGGMAEVCTWMTIDPSSLWLLSASVPSHGVPGSADQ